MGVRVEAAGGVGLQDCCMWRGSMAAMLSIFRVYLRKSVPGYRSKIGSRYPRQEDRCRIPAKIDASGLTASLALLRRTLLMVEAWDAFEPTLTGKDIEFRTGIK